MHMQNLPSTVVTNIEDTQDERKELRWTLTEWMRIKRNEDDGCMVGNEFRS